MITIYTYASNKFQDFFEHRKSLIQQFRKGDLSKEEFIKENFLYLKTMNVKPFKRVDNTKKAIFNYHFYNILAKHCIKKAYTYNRNSNLRFEYLEKAKYYYSKKDKTTLQLLRLIDYKNVEAYYIKVKSSKLKSKLIEIVLKDFNNLILHSASEIVKNELVYENVFEDKVKKSVIDNYINQRF